LARAAGWAVGVAGAQLAEVELARAVKDWVLPLGTASSPGQEGAALVLPKAARLANEKVTEQLMREASRPVSARAAFVRRQKTAQLVKIQPQQGAPGGTEFSRDAVKSKPQFDGKVFFAKTIAH
jgi:hypothetical protein